MVVEAKHQLLLVQIAKRGPYNDCALLRHLLDIARQVIPALLVLADTEFGSERNHKHIREVHNMKSIIPAKRGKQTLHLKGIRAQRKSNFPAKRYSQRNLIETVLYVVKRNLSARSPGVLIHPSDAGSDPWACLQPLQKLSWLRISTKPS